MKQIHLPLEDGGDPFTRDHGEENSESEEGMEER